MRSFIAVLALVAFFSVIARAEEKPLYLYTWDTYVAPELFKKFEKETGVKVITDIYSSNDTLMAKLKSGAAYDVVAPSGNYVPLLIAAKLLLPMPEELRGLGGSMVKIIQHPEYDPSYTYVLPLAYVGSNFLIVPLEKNPVWASRMILAQPWISPLW
ncbi:MAG: extracellular solute-binding protein [Proteobacteria bacterium]|nr:extracellular solute-binding protein [Pseudomonadota bacterium]